MYGLRSLMLAAEITFRYEVGYSSQYKLLNQILHGVLSDHCTTFFLKKIIVSHIKKN